MAPTLRLNLMIGTIATTPEDLTNLVGGVPLYGLRLPLNEVVRGAVPSSPIRAALDRCTMLPVRDLGVRLRPSNDIVSLDAMLDDCDWFAENHYDGPYPVLFGQVPGRTEILACLPHILLPGSDEALVSRDQLFRVIEVLGEGEDRGRPIPGVGTVTGKPEPVDYVAPAATGLFTKRDLARVLADFPDQLPLATREFERGLGGCWTLVARAHASQILSEVLGIRVDLGRDGRLVPASRIEHLLLLAYARWREPGEVPPEVRHYMSYVIPVVRALHVERWGGGGLAGAVYSCDLDVALNGPASLAAWARRRATGADAGPPKAA